MNREEWKEIKGYEGLYMVSNYGNVKSMPRVIYQSMTQHGAGMNRRIEGVYMSPTDNGKGYLIVPLSKNGKRKNHYVHRLVAEMFIGELGSKVINHKDFNTKNNYLENLEIVTQYQNIIYSRERMCNPNNNISINNKYIRVKDNKFEVTVNRRYLGRFSTLNDAITRRDNYIEEINYK